MAVVAPDKVAEALGPARLRDRHLVLVELVAEVVDAKPTDQPTFDPAGSD